MPKTFVSLSLSLSLSLSRSLSLTCVFVLVIDASLVLDWVDEQAGSRCMTKMCCIARRSVDRPGTRTHGRRERGRKEGRKGEVCIYVHASMCATICMCICIHVCMYVCMYVCACVRLRLYVYVYVYMYMYVCECYMTCLFVITWIDVSPSRIAWLCLSGFPSKGMGNHRLVTIRLTPVYVVVLLICCVYTC